MPAGEILEALDRTFATGSARVEVAIQLHPPWAAWNEATRRRGGLLRAAAKRVGRLARRHVEGWDRMHGEGFVDFAEHRSAIDFGAFGELSVGERRWFGRPGEALATVRPDEPNKLQPWWLLDLARGVTDVDPAGTDHVAGRPCRRFHARADMGRTSPALVVPPVTHFDELRRVPLGVWLDADGYVRRLADEGPFAGLRLDLVGLGVPLAVDWSRLPGAPARG